MTPDANRGRALPPDPERCDSLPNRRSDRTAHQLTIDDHHYRISDPPTSREAAASLTPRTVGRQVADVVVAVAAAPRGAICATVAADLDRDRGCVARRLTDAHRRGLIRPAGTRTAPSGRAQTVWVATVAGFDLAARRLAEQVPA